MGCHMDCHMGCHMDCHMAYSHRRMTSADSPLVNTEKPKEA